MDFSYRLSLLHAYFLCLFPPTSKLYVRELMHHFDMDGLLSLLTLNRIADASLKSRLHPVAILFRRLGVVRCHIYADFITWGFWPFHYKLRLSPVLLRLNRDAYKYPVVFSYIKEAQDATPSNQTPN